MAGSRVLQRDTTQLEEFRPGYPRYTALLSTHPAFQNFRRFTRTRLRLLLLKQDEIFVLEKTLDDIDTNEECELFLGCKRRDANPARQEVLGKLKTSLAEYDTMMEQSHRVMALPDPSKRDISSLKNWVEGTSCLSRLESLYLEDHEDLLNLTGTVDNAVTRIESLVEDSFFWTDSLIRNHIPEAFKNRLTKPSGDGNILILGPWLQGISRAITTWLATLVLLTPVILLVHISSARGRLAVIGFASGLFLSTMSLFTKAGTVDVFIAGASYAAVLVVFMSTGNGLASNSC
ncbi:hypothetical protein LSUE1_G001354 [Lachnellula suecica]|uniref:DUF6594 domain-containing protein n=1 Tax=Lachnellula suecica TaxID=602035 RepID=A0A8T9CKD6_9HELO|nr:hypothetical protein LSUE1_G001354 [Lachnellula suecica]